MMPATEVEPRVSIPAKLWAFLVEPRTVTALMLLIYLLVAVCGLSVLREPAVRLQQAWSANYERAWAVSLVVGGVLGLLSTPRGLWFVERAALILTGTGLLAYAAALFELHSNHAAGNQVIPGMCALVCALFMATRWVRIRWAALDPTK